MSAGVAFTVPPTIERAVLPLSPAQGEMTVAEYEARRCQECGVSHPPDDPNAPTLIATPTGPVCELEILGLERTGDDQ